MAVERSPVEWALLPLQRYAEFKGRAPRAEYWWFYLGTVIVGLIAGVIDAILGSEVGWLGGLLNLLLLVPTIAVTVRRLHDTDRSGWWLLIGIVAIIAAVAAAIAAGMASFGAGGGGFTPLMIGAIFVTVVVAITLFIFMVLPGTPGPNSYGPDPYNPDEQLEEVFA